MLSDPIMKIGDIILLIRTNTPYLISKRLDNIGQGQGGWLCIDMNSINEKGIENVSPFDYWRITDRYLDVQMQRGEIKMKNEN